MRYLTLLFLAVAITVSGCKAIDPAEEIPSYVRINTVDYNGGVLDPNSDSHNITDAWIYIDGELLGAFEIPCTVPVLKEGVHQLIVFAGVKQNGMNSLRPIYPFYEYFESTIILDAGQITEVQPSFTYSASTDIYWRCDFEGVGTNIDDRTFNHFPGLLQETTTNALEGISAGVTLDAAHHYCFLQSSDSSVLDPAQEIYFELNYRSDIPFQIGLSYTDPSSGQRVLLPWMEAFASGEWTKLYVRLNDCLGTPLPGVRYRPYILMSKPAEMSQATVLLDNLKLLN